MNVCKFHRERPSGYYCQKYGYYLCEECLRCHDREMYCKYRTSCIINFQEKENRQPVDVKER